MKRIVIFGSGGHAKVILSEILKFKKNMSFLDLLIIQKKLEAQ